MSGEIFCWLLIWISLVYRTNILTLLLHLHVTHSTPLFFRLWELLEGGPNRGPLLPSHLDLSSWKAHSPAFQGVLLSLRLALIHHSHFILFGFLAIHSSTQTLGYPHTANMTNSIPFTHPLVDLSSN